jgi:hypothetical protein
MEPITDHHDGHGLNESITITTDERDPNAGGASHKYEAWIGNARVAVVQFQHGARNIPGSVPGMTEAALMVILIDRLRAFQAGPFACRENAIQLTHLEEALHWTRARADARAKRGVLGQNLK